MTRRIVILGAGESGTGAAILAKSKGFEGSETGLKFSGTTVTPIGIPMIVVAAIPIRIAPGTLHTYKMIVMIRPITARSAEACERLKLLKPMIVPVSLATIPALARPIRQMNKPIPTETAIFRFSGIDLMIASRIPQNERIRNKTPSRRTAVKASCQEHPIPIHTVNVKNALRPIPGARATGRFATKPITKVAIAAERAVAVNTEPASIPVIPNIPGLTARM